MMNPNMKLTLSLFVALSAVMGSLAKSNHGHCPPFFAPFQESCYRAFGTKLNWQAAENACHDLFNGDTTAHLVSINSEAENLFVYELWKSATGNMVAQYDVTFWMGLTDADVEGTWVWTDGSEVSFTNWKPGQPDNSSGEDCAHQSNGDPNSNTWNDWGCEQEIYYVCEIPHTD
ncbi:alpha-N-acetylgalactosamine-specific lectin-like [Anneissia japonica]|uniref:alpha-N-acetylgalactosamine-specific lectin-like n=1 Tax=Anneissia japonica TaxID=1529436 RepID=UPI001425B35D|nr:alpha-N-acetylgalactosamine-specific lectin-like [Anneissia japonica]